MHFTSLSESAARSIMLDGELGRWIDGGRRSGESARASDDRQHQSVHDEDFTQPTYDAERDLRAILR
jgi:hypothetical protein